jgi:hypothetical protein
MSYKKLDDRVKELYLQFFIDSLKTQHQLDFEVDEVRDKLELLAQTNEVALACRVN